MSQNLAYTKPEMENSALTIKECIVGLIIIILHFCCFFKCKQILRKLNYEKVAFKCCWRFYMKIFFTSFFYSFKVFQIINVRKQKNFRILVHTYISGRANKVGSYDHMPQIPTLPSFSIWIDNSNFSSLSFILSKYPKTKIWCAKNIFFRMLSRNL